MNVLKTLGIRLLTDFLVGKTTPRPSRTLYQSYSTLLLPILPTIFQYWALHQQKSKNVLRGITLSALVVQGWICVAFAPKGLGANLVLKGGSLFFAYRTFKLGVLKPISSKKKLGILEYYRLVFMLSSNAGKAIKRLRNKRGGFLWYLRITFVQYLLANLIHLYFRNQPPQTNLTVRSLLSLKQPEPAVQQYLYLLLLYLYVSIYHFILVYPWCFLTGSAYSAIFDFSFILKKPKDLWRVRWNKRFHEDVRNHTLGPFDKALHFKRARAKPTKKELFFLVGVFAFFVTIVAPKILAIFEWNSSPTLEDPLFILAQGVTVGAQMGLEKILGKNLLSERFSVLLSNMFLIWSTPLLVTPLNKVIDMCAPPMMF